MRRWLTAILALLLLTGCAADEREERVAALQRRYADSGGCTAEVAVTLPRGDETLRYTLSLEVSGGETVVRVLSPDALAGITARVDGAKLTVECGDMVFDAGSVLPGVSAVNCAPLVLRAVASGYVRERSEETVDGEPALRVLFETEQDGQTLDCTVWFDADDTPLRAEVCEKEKNIADLEFTSFAFCATLQADG